VGIKRIKKEIDIQRMVLVEIEAARGWE